MRGIVGVGCAVCACVCAWEGGGGGWRGGPLCDCGCARVRVRGNWWGVVVRGWVGGWAGGPAGERASGRAAGRVSGGGRLAGWVGLWVGGGRRVGVAGWEGKGAWVLAAAPSPRGGIAAAPRTPRPRAQARQPPARARTYARARGSALVWVGSALARRGGIGARLARRRWGGNPRRETCAIICPPSSVGRAQGP